MDTGRRALLRRLLWLHFGRLVIAVIGVVAILVLKWDPEQALVPYEYAYSVLIAAIAVDVVYLLACRRVEDLRGMIGVEIAIDLLLTSALIYFTGGVESPFAYLYFLSVLASALLLSPRASLAAAASSTVLLSSIMLAYFLLHHSGKSVPLVDQHLVERVTRRVQFVLPYLFIFAVSLHLVALLAGRLAGELSQVRILNEEILQTMSGGVLAVDRGGRIAFANGPARYLLGIADGSVVNGVPFQSLLDEKRHAPLFGALSGLVSISQDAQFTARDGKPVWVSIETSVLREENGEPRGVVAILDDITLRRELAIMTARAERLSAVQELAAGMAHEIRNPLASMRGAIQELSDVLRLSGENQKLMEIILRESDRLNQIVSDFLDYARTRPLSLKRVDIGRLLDDVATLLRKRREEKKIEIVTDVPAGLECEADAELLRQVFLNLGINAVEATPDGGRVTMRGSAVPGRRASIVGIGDRAPQPPMEDGLRVEVVDTGLGMDADTMAQAGNPFFTTKPRGTGLGLAIVHRLVQAHRGVVEIESAPGRGTRISVWLPRTQGTKVQP